MFSSASIKSMAKALRENLSARQIDLSHSECLELIAKQFGMKDWNRLSAAIGRDSTDKRLSFSVLGDVIELHKTAEKLDASDANLSESRFLDVNISRAVFDQVNLSAATFNDVDMRNWNANDVNLSGSRFDNIDLAGVAFTNCRFEGATVNGKPLDALIDDARGQ